MNNKKIISSLLAIFFLIVISSFISAGCCEEDEDGFSCQNVIKSECKDSAKFAPTSCEYTQYCQTGTCLNIDSGTCSRNTPKTTCEEAGGTWKDKDPEEIPLCQNGCCLYGTQTAFVNQVECKQISSEENINVNFRKDISSQTECYALANSYEEGACIIENEYETNCLRTTKKECLDKKENKGSSSIMELFATPSQGTSIKVEFYPGFLCTAPQLNTTCSVPDNPNVVCSDEDDKAYFTDSCGNKANVYDASKIDDTNYWAKIQDPECVVGNEASNTCGNCNYRTGTICATYDNQKKGMPDDKPDYGNKVCRDLACYYDTDNDGNTEQGERYEHGESWCAEAKGTYPHLKKDELVKGSEAWKDLNSQDGVTKKYNIPGSRYVKLTCRNGQVLEQPCKDYRNAICIEESLADIEEGDGEYTHASCIANGWRNCFNITNKKDCENIDTLYKCKWVEGYRFDFKNVKSDEDPMDYSTQGSCVPLFSPGFKFWKDSSLSKGGVVKESVLYEVYWGDSDKDREDLKEDSSFAAKRCFSGNCYAIPNYGEEVSEDDWEKVWKGNPEINLNKQEYLSERKGHYCHKKGEPEAAKTGSFIGEKPDCLDNDGKRYQPPIFRNNKKWLNSIIERARSLGDVGYKRSVGGYMGQKSAEEIVSSIKKLNQDMETKSNITDRIVLWRAGEYTSQNKRESSIKSVDWDENGGGGDQFY